MSSDDLKNTVVKSVENFLLSKDLALEISENFMEIFSQKVIENPKIQDEKIIVMMAISLTLVLKKIIKIGIPKDSQAEAFLGFLETIKLLGEVVEEGAVNE